jgi:hypothetical protein
MSRDTTGRRSTTHRPATLEPTGNRCDAASGVSSEPDIVRISTMPASTS